MFPLYKSSPGLLSYAGRMLYRSTRRSAYLDFRRSYQTWSVARVGPYPKAIYDSADARVAAERYLDLLDRAKFLSKPDDSLRLVLFPEFAFNVQENYATPSEPYSHGAHTPHKTEIVETIRDVFRERAAILPPGFVFMLGGIAHDTGEQDHDGKIIGRNLGFVIESGLDRPFVVMSKYHHSDIDGWPDGYTLSPGTGPLDLTIADPSGGRPAQLSFFICLDARMGPFPEQMAGADLLAISGYGIPQGWDTVWRKDRKISAHAAIAAADAAPPGAITGKSGVLVQGEVAKHPLLKGMHTLVGEGWLGDALLWTYNTLLGLSSEDVLATVPGLVRLGTTRVSDGDLYLTMSSEHPFPEVKESDM